MNESYLNIINTNSKEQNGRKDALKLVRLKQGENGLIDNKITQEKKLKKYREPGIELIRILSMYAIIVHHFIYYGFMEK